MKKNLYQPFRVLITLVLITFFGSLAQAQELTISNISVQEDVGFATFSVSLSASSANAITVQYETSDNSAVNPEDYTATSGTITFPANSSVPQTIRIPIVNDLKYENSEGFYVQLSNAANATITNPNGYCTIVDNDASLNISSSVTVLENEGTATILVNLSLPVPYEVTVDYRTEDGNATSSQDYTSKSGKLTFPANSTAPQAIVVNITEETVFDPNEYFTVELSNAVNASINAATSYVYITDNEVQVNVGPAVTVTEGVGNATFSFVLSAAVPYEVRVDYSTSDGTATAPGDYTAKSGTVVFPANSTAPQTISIAITDDAIYNTNKYFSVDLSNAQNGTIGNGTVYGYITDNDVFVSIGSTSVTTYEDAGVAVFTASLSAPSAQQITVTFTTADNTATAPADYTATTGTITFPANSTKPVSFSVPIIDDQVFDDYESFSVTLSNAVNATVNAATAYAYIIDNDTQINLSAPLAVSEGGGSLSFSVYLTAPVDHVVTVDYSTSDGSATTPGDYTAKSGTITFPANSTAPQTVTVPVIEDNVFDQGEYMYLTLTNAVGGSINNGSTVGYIVDNDAQVIIGSGITVNESEGTVSLPVYLSNAVDHVVTVNYSTSNGSATTPGDYTASSGTLTFPANSVTPQTISVAIIDDKVYDPGEYLSVTLSNPTGGSLGSSSSSISITDNEAQINMFSGITVLESAGTATFTAYLTSAVPYDVTVNYATSNNTATAPGDFTAKSGTITFPANSTARQTISVAIISNATAESDETFYVTLNTPVNAALGNNTQACIITESTTPGSVIEIVANTSVSESAGNATILVSLSQANPLPVTVNFSTENGSAVEGLDYTNTSGTITFPANTTAPQTITVPIIDDYDNDQGEYFALTLSGAVNASIGTATQYTYIIDNDATIGIDPTYISLSEKDGTASFSVRLSQKVPYEVSVDYTTETGSAVPDEDFTATSGTVVFPANSVIQTFTVPIIDDQIFEGAEAFQIVLSNPVNAALGSNYAYANINDDDASLNFEPTSVTISEGAGTATFTVRLSQPLPQQVTVDYSMADYTALDGTDYTATSGTLTFPANSVLPQSFTVQILNDLETEGQESFSVTLSNPVNASLGSYPSANAYINDNDATVSLDPTNVYVNESAGKATFTVQLSRPIAEAVTVGYSTGDAGATAGADYAATSGTLTFPANSSEPQSFTVDILNDQEFEYSESFYVTISDAVNASIQNTIAYATITDDDATISFDPTYISITEGEGLATFTVTLSQPVAAPVTVQYATTDYSAIAGEDYTAKSGTITFPANSIAPQSFTVPITDDKVYDPNESFGVNLTDATNATILYATATVSIVGDNDAFISIDPNSAYGSEATGAVTFTATISRPVPYEVKVDYSTVDGGGATAGADYAVKSGTLVFPANSALPQNFVVQVMDDLLYDPNEYIVVNLSNAENGTIPNPYGYGYIIDNDPKVSLAPASVSVSESGGTANFTVTLSDVVPFDVTVNYKTTAGTATEGTDYVGKSGTVRFPAYSDASQTISIAISDDFNYEANETFTVTISEPTGGFLGNTTATGTINDNDLEIASTPAAITVSCAGEVPVAAGSSITVNNHCNDTPVITVSDAIAPGFTCANRYVITRTWTVTNTCGNNKTTTQTITVNDQTAPVIAGTPATLNVTCSASVPTASISAVTATDNCAGTVTVTVADVTTPGTCANKYMIVRTWTATDVCGNKSTSSQTINVNDNVAPVIAGTPANSTVTCAADVSVASIASVTATDNCVGAVTVTVADAIAAGSCANKYVITRTWTATDICGNQSTSSQTITVNDNVAPVLSGTPVALTVSCAADVPVKSTTGLTATDNCTGTVTITVDDVTTPGSCANKFTVTRTWTATDICGNKSTSSQIITVDDKTAPVISGTPTALQVSCAADVPVASISSVTATDNCAGSVTITVADVVTAGSCVNKYSITRTWTATDVCGNKTTSSQVITVNDNVIPVIATCTLNQSFTTDPNVCTYTVKNNNLVPAATDNCTNTASITFKYTLSGVTTSTAGQYTSLNGVVFNKGVTTVSVKAYDICGNESVACSYTVTVADGQAPVTPVLAAVTGECSATAVAPTTTDNCDGTITGTTTNPLVYSTQGTHTIVWTFTDSNGNSTTANQSVVVDDVTAPVKPTIAGVTGECSVTVSTVPTTTDNCGGTISGTTVSPLTYNTPGTHTIAWVFNDGRGNSVTANQTVTVTDVTAPVKPTLANVTGVCTVTPVAPTTTDNCGGTITGTTTTAFPITHVGTTVVTWTFSDGSGNTVTANQNVIVLGSDEIATTPTSSTTTFTANDEYAYDNNCQLVTRIIPINLTGSVTSNVWIESDNVSGIYVKRHYQITPAVNPTTSSATVTLYFTQAEFDVFSAAVTDDLPKSPDDKAGKANLRIVKFVGSAPGGLGYTGDKSTINPDDDNIVFVNGRWEVTFTVTGFSGFFVTSEFTPLPVTLISFNGKKTGENQNTLNWVTADELDFKGFEVQKSEDAKHFETIGWVASLTETGTLKTYQFNDNKVAFATSYYRLKMIDTDGTIAFSKIINIGNTIEKSIVGQFYPNPVIDGNANIDIVAAEQGEWVITYYDLTGRVISKQVRALSKGKNKVNIKSDPSMLGTMVIRFENQHQEVQVRKLIKQ